jgi:methylmalonyl-CoA carboxyltransferase 1.3S subunit
LKLRIAVEGKTYEVEVEIADESGLDSSTPGTAAIQSSVLPPAVKVNTSSGLDETKVSRSPVAGLVVRMHVKPGQEVEAGELLMVLEAMKMETNITASAAGKILSVDVAPGDAVKLDQILLQFE